MPTASLWIFSGRTRRACLGQVHWQIAAPGTHAQCRTYLGLLQPPGPPHLLMADPGCYSTCNSLRRPHALHQVCCAYHHDAWVLPKWPSGHVAGQHITVPTMMWFVQEACMLVLVLVLTGLLCLLPQLHLLQCPGRLAEHRHSRCPGHQHQCSRVAALEELPADHHLWCARLPSDQHHLCSVGLLRRPCQQQRLAGAGLLAVCCGY